MKRQLNDFAEEAQHSNMADEEIVNNGAQSLDKPLVLIADDTALNRELLAEILKDNYRTIEASDGIECLETLKEHSAEIAAVLLDIVMPNKTGLEVLKEVKDERLARNIPIIMISGATDPETIRASFDLGATDYISRPFDAYVVSKRVSNAVRLYAKQRALTQIVLQQYHERDRYNTMLVDILGQVVESHNGESNQHVRNIHVVTQHLLNRYAQKEGATGLPPSRRALIAMASALHDIGKIDIPGSILNKPGKLTDEEFEIMKTHTVLGGDMIRSLTQYEGEELTEVAYEICRWHHERYDGRGYPDGLKADEIPLSAQVVSLADVYDALTSERVYKAAFSHEKAMAMILDNQCGVFNPKLLECLKDVQYEIADVIGVKHD